MPLSRLRRPVSQMTVVEQQLEGEFRYVNSRLITHRYQTTALYCVVLIMLAVSIVVSIVNWSGVCLSVCLSVCFILAPRYWNWLTNCSIDVTGTHLGPSIKASTLVFMLIIYSFLNYFGTLVYKLLGAFSVNGDKMCCCEIWHKHTMDKINTWGFFSSSCNQCRCGSVSDRNDIASDFGPLHVLLPAYHDIAGECNVNQVMTITFGFQTLDLFWKHLKAHLFQSAFISPWLLTLCMWLIYT